VTRFGSYRIVLVALLFYVLSLTNLGFRPKYGNWFYLLCLDHLETFGHINTQGVHTGNSFRKTIMASFHGV
jgi:hypothetical protein